MTSLRYLFFNIAVWLKQPFSRRARHIRMIRFLDELSLKGGESVIDLGGTAEFWRDFPVPAKIVVLNLPGEVGSSVSTGSSDVTLVEGDACHVDFAADKSFDVVFSNSVIEHVGGTDNQMKFAAEVRRLAPRYWVQTPSIWFPVEAHTHMPFWWFYPEPLKAAFLRSWRKKLPDWSVMIEGTTVISHGSMQAMFPDAEIWTERYLGFPKSYVAFKR